MSRLSAVLLTSSPAPVESRPAGGAALDEVIIATAIVGVLTLALGVAILAYRAGRLPLLDRVLAGTERTALGILAPWAALPIALATVSLLTALLGMYWDIALHIGVGRDEGPLANPAHYPILLGLFGISAAGVLACSLPREDEAGPAAIELSRTWHAPAGGVLLTAAGSYALLGFPLDDVWHRLFGQDVTLWGPTHLMLIGGAGLSLVAIAVLFEEGRTARRKAQGTSPTADPGRGEFRQRVFLCGGLLIGLSVFQAEWDFGVPQFRLVLQPLLIAVAATLALVVARLWIGPGGALGTAIFYVVVRGGVSVVVGPVLGELWAAIPLYLAEAILVELAGRRLADRPIALGVVSGVLIGTIGFAAEYAWTQVAFRLPWTTDILVEGVLLATVGAVAAGLLGGMLVLGLRHELHPVRGHRAVFALALAAIAACVTNGVVATTAPGLTATTRVLEITTTEQGESAMIEVEFNRPPREGAQAWLTATAWQGNTDEGLHVDHLERVDDVTWRTTTPLPVAGTWKSLIRVHDGRDLSASAVFMPEDAAIDEPEVPLADGGSRPVGEEKLILQRELSDDAPLWLWTAGGLVVLLCSAALVLALGWGVSRFSRAAEVPGTPADPETVRA